MSSKFPKMRVGKLKILFLKDDITQLYPIMAEIPLRVGFPGLSQPQIVRYSFFSSTSVSEVYCTRCHGCCNYCYPWPHQIVAYWTKGKIDLLCKKCAGKIPNTQLFRPIYPYHDLCKNRSAYIPTQFSFEETYIDIGQFTEE